MATGGSPAGKGERGGLICAWVMTARAEPKIEPGATIIEIVIGTARVRVLPGIIDVSRPCRGCCTL